MVLSDSTAVFSAVPRASKVAPTFAEGLAADCEPPFAISVAALGEWLGIKNRYQTNRNTDESVTAQIKFLSIRCLPCGNFARRKIRPLWKEGGRKGSALP